MHNQVNKNNPLSLSFIFCKKKMTIYTVVIVNTHLYLEKLFSETANAGPSPNAWGVCIFCIIVVCSSTETWMPFQILMRFHSEHRHIKKAEGSWAGELPRKKKTSGRFSLIGAPFFSIFSFIIYIINTLNRLY